ncbi:uncharacterized protein METZ01_LOCUS291735, partial [marine metagenome]
RELQSVRPRQSDSRRPGHDRRLAAYPEVTPAPRTRLQRHEM